MLFVVWGTRERERESERLSGKGVRGESKRVSGKGVRGESERARE